MPPAWRAAVAYSHFLFSPLSYGQEVPETVQAAKMSHSCTHDSETFYYLCPATITDTDGHVHTPPVLACGFNGEGSFRNSTMCVRPNSAINQCNCDHPDGCYSPCDPTNAPNDNGGGNTGGGNTGGGNTGGGNTGGGQYRWRQYRWRQYRWRHNTGGGNTGGGNTGGGNTGGGNTGGGNTGGSNTGGGNTGGGNTGGGNTGGGNTGGGNTGGGNGNGNGGRSDGDSDESEKPQATPPSAPLGLTATPRLRGGDVELAGAQGQWRIPGHRV